ncbi:hypothetical protein JCM11251_005592 [Rhodosporidiobolus azoricus]
MASPSLASPRAQQVSSAADLTAAVRRTNGERPPPLVGCSITLIGDSIYVFGGRLVPTRTMVSTLYRLDLRSLTWTLLSPSPSTAAAPSSPDSPSPADTPQARYFHSACAWGDKLVIFGGEGYEPTSPNGDGPSSPSSGGDSSSAPSLRTLDDVCIWDTTKDRWMPAETKCKEGVERPAPRYAHLGAVTSAVVEEEGGVMREKSVMLVMGGQDLRNTYLHSANVLDLDSLTWIHAGTWDRHIGTYRAVCTAPPYTVYPTSTVPSTSDQALKLGLEEGEQLTQLSYSEKPAKEKAEPLLLFSNFNFTAVRRDLDLLACPLSSTPLAATSLSSFMTGPSLPPGLRFPTGTIIGRHLLVFGTFLSHTVNNFAIWALDLGSGGAGGVKGRIEKGEKLEWMRIDPGSTLARGSWNRAVAWGNTLVVLGDRERDIASDYDHRQTNFTHLAFVDCESFGIYQPPPRPLDPLAQQFGLLTLSQPFLFDFEIVCSDGKRLGCSRKVLLERWSWFAEKMKEFKHRASGVQSAQQKREAESSATASESGEKRKPDEEEDSSKPAPDDLRLSPRTLSLPEPSPVVQAFLQYLYTLSLTTPLQLHPPVLAALVVFAKTYHIAMLRAACVHALHGVLDKEGAAAPLVYEAATISGATALQIRALRTMLGNSTMRARASQVPSAAQGVDSVQVFLSAPMTTSTSRQPAPPSVTSAISSAPNSVFPAGSDSSLDAPLINAAFSRNSPTSSLAPFSPPPAKATCSPTLPPPPSLPLPPPPPISPLSNPEARKRRSDAVAQPIPDDVPPIPVPIWSPFLPLDLPLLSPPAAEGRRPSISSSLQSHPSQEGYFDALLDLLSDGEESDTGTVKTKTDSLFGSPTQTYVSLGTRATSIRSRSSSLGSPRSAKGSNGPLSGHWKGSLPTQLEVEEEEAGSASLPIPPDPPHPSSLSTSKTSTGSSFVAVPPPAELPKAHPSSAHLASSSLACEALARPIPRLSLPPVFNRKSRRESKSSALPLKTEGTVEEHWTPGFFDTVKGAQGSMRNPLSTRKATEITPEMLASLDVGRLTASPAVVAGVSAPLETLSPPMADEKRFSNPRPVPLPLAIGVGPSASTVSSADSPSSSSTPRSSTSASSTSRRHSFDPISLRKNHPRSSSLAASSTASATLAPPQAGFASRLRRAASGKASSSPATEAHSLIRSSPTFSAPGEVAAKVLVFDPSSDATVPLSSPLAPLQSSSQPPHLSSSPELDPAGLPLPPQSPSQTVVDSRRPSLPTGLPSSSSIISLAPSTSSSHSSKLAQNNQKERKSASTVLFAAITPVSPPSTSNLPPLPTPKVSAPPPQAASPSSSSSSSSSPALSPKEARLALELSLGRQLLSSAGASEKEIRLRARSVGFQALKKHEEEVRRAKKEGREVERGTTGAMGEYLGGGRLESKFSLD